MAIASQQSGFVKSLMKTLGLDGHGIIGFCLRVKVDEAVTIEVLQYVDEPDGDIDFKRYELVWEEIVADKKEGGA